MWAGPASVQMTAGGGLDASLHRIADERESAIGRIAHRGEETRLIFPREKLAIRRAPKRRIASQRGVFRMRREQLVVDLTCIAVVTRPAIVEGETHHAGADRVPFDVAIAGEYVRRGIHEARPIAALPQ